VSFHKSISRSVVYSFMSASASHRIEREPLPRRLKKVIPR
jgi:hypothetical protein